MKYFRFLFLRKLSLLLFLASLFFVVPKLKAQEKYQFSLDENVFSKVAVTLEGNYDSQIKSISINGKKAKLDAKSYRWKFSLKLKEEQNKIKIVLVDKQNKKQEHKRMIYLDQAPPKVTLKELPKITDDKSINIHGTITEKFLSSVLVYPTAKIEYFSLRENVLNAKLYLHEGKNVFYITVIDKSGNSEKKNYEIFRKKATVPSKPKSIKKETTKKSYNKNLQVKKQSTSDKKLQQEVLRLQEQVKNLENELEGKSSFTEISNEKEIVEKIIERKVPASVAKVPTAPGIYLLPFLGRENNYRSAARIYLHSEDMAAMLASFNGRKEKQWKNLLIPSPALFTLVKRSVHSASYQKIFRYAGTQFVRNPTQDFVQRNVLGFLSETNMLKKVHQKKYNGNNCYVFEISEKSGIVFVKGDISSTLKTELKLNELFVVKVSKKGLLVKRI